MRCQVLAMKERDYVLAAHATGVPDGRVVLRHLLPNTMSPILVAATLNVANAVLMESYISFLGYGIQPPTASWGNMLQQRAGLSRHGALVGDPAGLDDHVHRDGL